MQSIMEFDGHFIDRVILVKLDGFTNGIDDDLAGIAVSQVTFKVCTDIGVDVFVYIII